MKTLIIFNSIEDDLKYLIVEGDFSRYHGITVGNGFHEEVEDEFCNWFFNPKTGEFMFELSEDSTLLSNKEWDKIAIVNWVS